MKNLTLDQLKYVPLFLILVFAALYPTNLQSQDSATEIISSPYKILYHQNTSGISLEKATVTVQLFDLASDEPATNAKVKILVDHSSTDNQGWAPAIPLDDSSNIYVAELNLKSPGSWKTSIEITDSLNNIAIDVEDILIRENESFSAGTIVFWGVALVIAIGAFLIYLTAPNRKKQSSR